MLLRWRVDQVSSPAHRSANKLANRRQIAAGSSVLHAKTALGRLAGHNFDRTVFWPAGQILTGLSRRLTLSLAIAALSVAASPPCRSNTASEGATSPVGNRDFPRGGELLVSARPEPRSFNRHAAQDTTTNLVSTLTQARLVRVNQATQAIEPALAESWTASDDGRRVTLALRQGVSFSDGHPFTADDAVFSFEAAYDAKSGSLIADAMQAGGKNLQVTAPDPHTVVITFPAPFAPGIRILDTLPILPRHKLEAAVKAGALTKAWGLDTPPSEIVGLGPFVLREYVPGQRLIFARNPHYFLKAPDGGTLPYLDRLVVEIIPDQSAELLRLESGQLDMMTSEIAPQAYAPMKRAADEGRVKLLDLGVSRNADGFWFNLKPGVFAQDPRAAWLQRDELRHAISLSVDRKVFADTVFLGAGVPVFGPETPANKVWYWPELPQVRHDLAAAKQLLASIGLTDKNGDGLLEDPQNRPARFTLLTQKGRPNLERGATVIRDELKKIGLTVDVVTLDAGAVIDQLIHARYEAIYFNADKSDLDPGTNPDFWFSFGTAHMWNLQEQTPVTAWERRIDELMARQIASTDERERKTLYNEVQKI